MMGQLLGNLLNVILDPIMILLFDWGIAGAAIATVIGNVFGAVYYIVYFLRGKSVLSIHPKDFTVQDKVCTGVLAIGIPASLGSLLMSVSQIILNSQMAHYGNMAVAGMGVAAKVTMITGMVCVGMGQGVQPLIGFCVGAKKWERFKKIMNFSLVFLIFLILCWFGLYKQALGCFAVYLVAIVWLMIETKYQISIPSPLLLSMIYKLLLPAMPAYLLAKIPSGKLTACLRKMPIPTRIMLVLIVMLRFAPTVLHEFGEVREAMKIRGFLKSVGNVLKHPMDTLEYAIVPMVFRSLKIADELAASSIVRGIESPYKKESYYVSRIAALDCFLIVVSVGATVCCCLL